MFNFILGLIIGGAGIWMVTRQRNLDSSAAAEGNDKSAMVINPEQVEKRQENLEKVLEMAKAKGEIRNDEVEHALKVSDSTAERYLEQLVGEGKLTRIGARGQSVFYKPK
ncbi:MAG: hypothetical protein Q8R08_01435 [bacterium]|nr:hypothetical protein [bacterium]